jgi:hypothetical protein
MIEEEFDLRLKKILEEPNHQKAFYNLCDLYFLASNERQRREIRDEVIVQREWDIPDIRLLAMRLPDEPDRETRIRAALISLSFWRSADWRDNLFLIAIIYDSLKLIGKDGEGWLRYFADISFPTVATALLTFASYQDKSLKPFGWVTEITDRGIIYNQLHSKNRKGG